MNDHAEEHRSQENISPGISKTEIGQPPEVMAKISALVRRAFSLCRPDAHGWIDLGALGAKIKIIDTSFYPGQYGYLKLSELVESCGIVETRRDETKHPPVVYGRLKITADAAPQAQPIPTAQNPVRVDAVIAPVSPRPVRPPYRPVAAPIGRLTADQLKFKPPMLTEWAFFPARQSVDEIRYRPAFPVGFARGWVEAVQELRKKTLKEPWEFGGVILENNPSPILQSYLWYTFYRLCKERKIMQGEDYAAFNTGLVDKRYEQIYALFEANRTPGRQPWVFLDFCTHGERGVGEKLVRSFRPLPEPAHYFERREDLIYDLSKGEPLIKDHLIEDNVTRFPLAFIRDNCPKGFEPYDCSHMNNYKRDQYSEEFKRAIQSDHRKYRAMINVVEDSVKTALKRVRWNFKTAIPQYYPTKNHMNLLLPLAIVSDEITDVAIVVEKVESGHYLGHTILPLVWAYNNARLVCRPNSDWLIPDDIKDGEDSSSEQETDGEDASPGHEFAETQ